MDRARRGGASTHTTRSHATFVDNSVDSSGIPVDWMLGNIEKL
jgi:hypothetical protein